MTIQVLLAQPGGHTRHFPGGMLPNGEHILGCEGGILTCSVYHILGAVPQPGQFEGATLAPRIPGNLVIITTQL